MTYPFQFVGFHFIEDTIRSQLVQGITCIIEYRANRLTCFHGDRDTGMLSL